MRVLILGLNFHPEPTGVGKFTGEMAGFLAAQGHEVHAISAPPYYPHWKVAKGYRTWTFRRETLRGVRVTRCPIWVPGRPTGFKRSLHLLSFALSSFPAVLAEVGWKPQVVVAIAPTILSAPSALLLARLSGAKSWLHIQDFEFDAAMELGLLPGSGLFQRAMRSFERTALGRFDRVSSISEAMLERAGFKGVPAARQELFPNWVDTQEIHPTSPDPAAFGLPADKVIALYSGNLGEKQGLSMLIEVARELQNAPDVHLVICGEGAQREEIEALAAGHTNLTFLPLQDRESFNALLNCAGMHLLPELPGASDLVMPSKLAAMMASARPTVASATAGSEIDKLLSGAGLVIPPGDSLAMADAIRRLAGDKDLREQLGANARIYAERHFSSEAILPSFARKLEDLADQA